MALQGGDVHCGAHRQRRVLQHELLGALQRLSIDRQHLVHHTLKCIPGELDAAAALERGVAVQDLSQYFGVGDEPNALGDERFKPAFWDVLKIVTAFTVAHSITLSLAALGVISLPTRLIESAIALSVEAYAVWITTTTEGS